MARLVWSVLLAGCVCLGGASEGTFVRLEPCVTTHLRHAQRLLSEGRLREAKAHCEVVAFGSPLSLRPLGSKFDPILEQAAGVWNQSLGFPVFRLGHRGETTEVRFEMVPSLIRDGRPVAGLADWRRDVWYEPTCRSRIEALIRLRTTQEDGQPMPQDALLQTAVHELGHILGLADSDQGVMAPLDPSRRFLPPAPAEVEAVRSIFADARRISAIADLAGVLKVRR